MLKKYWCYPSIEEHKLYADALTRPHILIAGATGAGKSVAINGLIYTALHRTPDAVKFILIDPKRVELKAYAGLPHTIAHAAGHNPDAWRDALQTACNIMDARYNRMTGKLYNGPDVYVIIDEFADISKSGGKECYQLVLRLLSEGRAARVHCIIATQVPNAVILPTELRGNIAYRFALRTNNRTESRIIMDAAGCEDLPDFGYCYYYRPGKDNRVLHNVPYIEETELDRIVSHWTRANRPRYKWQWRAMGMIS